METIRARAKNILAINQFWSEQPIFDEFLKIGSFRPLGDALIFRLVLESPPIYCAVLLHHGHIIIIGSAVKIVPYRGFGEQLREIQTDNC